ncbi:MAG: PAS-domain containing protein [Rhodocyclaceae bacterium]|nr:PAS-domain containing protein [Rhodocyclaceae bacterium]
MPGLLVLSLSLLAALVCCLYLIRGLRRRLDHLDSRLAAFEEFSSDWIWEQDADFRFTDSGPDATDGAVRGGEIGHTRWHDGAALVDPGAMAEHRQQCEQHLPFCDFQYGLRQADDSVRWFVASGCPVFDDDGRFTGYRGLAREETRRLKMERALRRSEQHLAAVAAGSPVPMFALDDRGRVILWNRGCEVVLGVRADEMLGRRDVWRAFYGEARPVLAGCVLAPDPQAAAARLYGARVKPSESIPGALEAEGFFPRMAGRDRWLAFVAAPMLDDDGQVIGAIETVQDITERKLAEQQLEQRNATLRALIDNMPSGISLVNGELELVAWNERFLALLDLPASLFEQAPVRVEDIYRFNARRGEYGDGDVEAQVAALMASAAQIAGGARERSRPGGTTLEIRTAPMNGGGFVSIYTDITARKAAEAAQRLQSAYLAAVIDHLPQGISVFDHELRLKHWNGRLSEICDLPAEFLHADARFEDLVRIPAARGEYGPGSPEEHVERLRSLALQFEPHSFERARPNGKAHLVDGRPMVVDGRIAGFVTTYTDITERRRNERLLERQRAELEAAQCTAHIGSWRWPATAARPECSAEMLRLLGVDEIVPRHALRRFLRRVLPAERATLVAAVRALVASGERLDGVWRLGGEDRKQLFLRLVANVERHRDGRIIAYSGIAQDVTELRKAEDALRASGEMLKTIFEQGPVPLALVRIDSEVMVMANRAWRQLFAAEQAVVVGHTLGSVDIWRDRETWTRLRERLRRGHDIVDFEAALIRHDGGELVCEISGRAVEVEGDPLMLASFVDVTEERRIRAEIEALNASLENRVWERTSELRSANEHLAKAMRQLVQAEKLASLGGLVAGIAHELNTPLGNATTVASALRERVVRFGDDAASGRMRRSTLKEFVSGCDEATVLLERNVNRAARQVAHFKQVAVDQASERRRRFDLRTTIEEVVSALSPQLRHSRHAVRIEIDEGIELDSFPGPLEQIVTNLVENALIHGFDGDDAGVIRIVAANDGGPTVAIEICDDGRGMTREVRDRAFDPFYTTRLGKGGSGLGLYIVFNLVTSVLGGSITLTSEPGHGTCFHVDMPRVAPEARQPDG